MHLLAIALLLTAPGDLVIPPAAFATTLAPWQRLSGAPAVATDPDRGACVKIDGPGTIATELLPYDGQFLEYSWWMRTDGIVRGKEAWHQALGQVEIYDAEQKVIRHFDGGLTVGTSSWTAHQMKLHWPEKMGVAYFRLLLTNWNIAGGTSWFAAPQVTEVAPPESYLKVPPLKQVENQPPIRWPDPALRPLKSKLEAGPITVECASNLALSASVAGGPTVAVPGPAKVPPGLKVEAGTRIDRGWMTQLALRVTPEATPDQPLLEGYAETFRGSPILSLFKRVWLRTADSALMAWQLELTGSFEQMVYFEGDRPVRGAIAPVDLSPETCTKPFVVLHNADDSAGVVLYFPHPFELRRWYIEDYLIEQAMPARLRFEPVGGGLKVAVAGPVIDGAAFRDDGLRSLDGPLFVMPYRGAAAEALAQFTVGADMMKDEPALHPSLPRGYWTPRMPANVGGARLLRMARYFPTEFASWQDAGSKAHDYGHADGFAWGGMTQTMKGIRVDPLATVALARDHAFRMEAFFLEQGDPKGAPPDLSMNREWAAALDDPLQIRTHVFCQYWEYRVEEMRRLMQSPLLTEAEKSKAYQELQRARYVYDPGSPGTWSEATPNGGLWFRYMDVWSYAENQWVINTHTTSVGNVGELALLAKDRGEAADVAYWTDLFRKGIDGLLYATGLDAMWYVGAHDPNELRYGIKRGGPRGYHGYMVTAWVPRIMQQAAILAPDKLPPLIALERRMMQAKYLANEPGMVKAGEAAIAAAEAALP